VPPLIAIRGKYHLESHPAKAKPLLDVDMPEWYDVRETSMTASAPEALTGLK
jgi:hypothetical protein